MRPTKKQHQILTKKKRIKGIVFPFYISSKENESISSCSSPLQRRVHTSKSHNGLYSNELIENYNTSAPNPNLHLTQ